MTSLARALSGISLAVSRFSPIVLIILCSIAGAEARWETIGEMSVEISGDDPPVLSVPGHGSALCSSIAKIGVSGRKYDGQRAELAAWSEGYFAGLWMAYVTAISSHGDTGAQSRVAIEYDTSGHWTWLVRYCEANPNRNLAEAVSELFMASTAG